MTASMKAARTACSSKARSPNAVVPPGEVTIARSASGSPRCASNADDPTTRGVKSCTDVARVFTKGTSWKADSATWAKIAAASGPVTVSVYVATLDNSAVKDGTEATGSKPVAFTVK